MVCVLDGLLLLWCSLLIVLVLFIFDFVFLCWLYDACVSVHC